MPAKNFLRKFYKTPLWIPLLFFTITSCSIVIPPVTLTGSKTAVEKQIIGEQKDIEKDIWMMASAKTTTQADIEMKPTDKSSVEKENAFTYRGLVLMDVYKERLSALRADGVVGENNRGFLSNMLDEKNFDATEILSAEILHKYDSSLEKEQVEGEAYRNLLSTVKEVNRARDFVAKGFIENQKRINKYFDATAQEIIFSQVQVNIDKLKKGEFYQDPQGNWLQK